MNNPIKNTVYEECWATHEALRRLHVPPEEIFVAVNHLPEVAGSQPAQVVVEAHQSPPVGPRAVFSVHVGTVPDADVFVREWQEFAETANRECNSVNRGGYYTDIMARSAPWNDTATFMMGFLGAAMVVRK